jgi:hypothetical protein
VAVSELFALLLASLGGAVRDRSDLVAENLLLRHQLAVLTRPVRRRPRWRTRDTVLWVLAQQEVLDCQLGTTADGGAD